MLKEFCAARALRSRQARIGAWPAGASQRHQRPSSLLRDKKGEDPRVVGGAKELGLAGGKDKRESVREERKQGDNGWDGFQVTHCSAGALAQVLPRRR